MDNLPENWRIESDRVVGDYPDYGKLCIAILGDYRMGSLIVAVPDMNKYIHDYIPKMVRTGQAPLMFKDWLREKA